MKPIIVIPALDPDEHLTALVEQLREQDGQDTCFIIINDGSAKQSDALFELLALSGCIVLRHEHNRGKGAALKTAFAYILEHMPEAIGCVTADADGQHSPRDILRLSRALEQQQDALILGSRQFDGDNVPFKSKWGNTISAWIFKAYTGVACPDTQTGLRAVPQQMMSRLLDISGDRFEFETNVLIELAQEGIAIRSVPIETVYRDQNSHSHFRAVRDSLRVYNRFIKYGLSSLAGAAVDYIGFLLLLPLIGSDTAGTAAANALARLLSGAVNFTMNRIWVFKSRNNSMGDLFRYIILFVCQMGVSSAGVALLSRLIAPFLAKLIVDTLLFFVSFYIQKSFVFERKKA